MVNTFIKNRRLQLLVLCALLSVVLGFFSFKPEQCLSIVIYGGYWTMLAVAIAFGLSAFFAFRDCDWRKSLSRAGAWPFLLIAGCGAFLFVHATFSFKILMDESMLLGTSLSMHLDKSALLPMRGHDILGAFQLLGGQLDKRPLFFPFLLSLLHDFTGYRPENAFILNGILTFVFLGLLYSVVARIAGRMAAVLSVVLMTGLPLLAQNATGGGFELLNLVMILAVFALGIHALDKRDERSLSAFCLAGVLLAQTRYESVLFLLPVALVVLWVWIQERRPVIGWGMIIAPLCMLPYALQNKVFQVRESSWELGSQPGYDKPFSFSYIGDNIAHALNYLFDFTRDQSNFPVLSLLGCVALPFVILWVLKLAPKFKKETAPRIGMAIFTLGFLANLGLLMCYFWGKIDDVVITRLSLPMHLFFAIGAAVVIREVDRTGRILKALIVLTVAGIFGFSLPAMSRHDYTIDYYVGEETQWRREFVRQHPERDYLVIDNSSITWVTFLVSSTPFEQVRIGKDRILFNFRNHVFSEIYVFQRLTVDPETGTETIADDENLGPDFTLQTVWEKRFTPLTVSRISKITAITDGDFTAPVTDHRPLDQMNPEEREKLKRDYYNRFIRMLP